LSVEKIITYDEIPDKKEVFLNGLSFSLSPFPEIVEEARRCDNRLPREFAFFALGNEGELLGRACVGITKIDTKEGRLKAGVLWGVRTAPWRIEKGVAKNLVIHAQKYLETSGVDVLSLGVFKYSIVYHLYFKLGYREVDDGIRRTALKWAEKRKERLLKASPYILDDAGEVQKILSASNEGLYGYTIRDVDFISKRRFLGKYNPKNVLVYRNGSEVVGYCACRSKHPVVGIGEIRAVNEEEYLSILADVESAHPGQPIQVFNGFSMREEEWLKEAGFIIQPGAYNTKMMHGLGRRSNEKIRDILGTEDGLFRQQTLFDLF
jgi:hypothetical protein